MDEETQKKVLMVRDLPAEELPREKLLRYGAESLSEAELLAILLRTGTRDEPVMRLAERVLAECHNLGVVNISKLSPVEFCHIKGVGEVKAITVMAAIELGKRLSMRPMAKKIQISSPREAADYVMPRLRDEARENFLVMMLDTKHQIISVPMISVGSLNASIVHPREVFCQAVRISAAAMILLHNHPSGDPEPSREDLAVTEKLVKAGQIMGISVLDHVIIGDNRYISLKERGLMMAG